MHVPRQLDRLTVLATRGTTEDHLLHYDGDGWQLESFGSPKGLWPTEDGGLWSLVDHALWHRDPDGGWRHVELPPGITEVSVAMRGDLSELWIAGWVAGDPVVYKTRANAQEPVVVSG
jgi:hypothetical protein